MEIIAFIFYAFIYWLIIASVMHAVTALFQVITEFPVVLASASKAIYQLITRNFPR